MSDKLSPADVRVGLDQIGQAIEHVKAAGDALVDGSRKVAGERIDKAREALASLRAALNGEPGEVLGNIGGS